MNLEDIASVRRGYVDPPSQLVRVDGLEAITLHVSLKDGANRTTGDNTGTRRSRAKENATCAPAPSDVMRKGTVLNRNLDHCGTRTFKGLPDRLSNLVGLSEADTDFALAIAHSDERGE